MPSFLDRVFKLFDRLRVYSAVCFYEVVGSEDFEWIGLPEPASQ